MPDRLINLTKFLGKESPQKIESIAVEGETKKYIIIHLVADNDDGESILFKMQLKIF